MIPLYDVKKLHGLKRRDIKPCAICGKGMMHGGAIDFYRVTVEHYVVDLAAVRRQHGLEQFMGSPAIAQAMGPDEDLAKRMSDEPVPMLVCSNCAMERHALAVLADKDASERAEREREFDAAGGAA